MADNRNKGKAADGGPVDAGQAEVQAKVDEHEEQGFEGYVTDETPNEKYSLEGGAPKQGDNPESSRVHPDKEKQGKK